jgi:hypothetical protein
LGAPRDTRGFIIFLITVKLLRFIQERAGPNGLYKPASEYLRDLIGRDFQCQEERKWSWLFAAVGNTETGVGLSLASENQSGGCVDFMLKIGEITGW